MSILLAITSSLTLLSAATSNAAAQFIANRHNWACDASLKCGPYSSNLFMCK